MKTKQEHKNEVYVEELRRLYEVSEEYAWAAWHTLTDQDRNNPVQAAVEYGKRYHLQKNPGECKHTPGPWMVDDCDSGVIVCKDGDIAVCSIGCIPKKDFSDDIECYEITRANARLIAAAPDLLEALKGLVNIATHPQATKDQIRQIAKEARATIAKAKGRE